MFDDRRQKSNDENVFYLGTIFTGLERLAGF